MAFTGFRLSIRSVLVAIALIGLNLAGAVVTSRFYPIEQIWVGADDYGRGAPWFHSDGSIDVRRTTPGTSQKPMVRILYRRPPLTTPQIWAPVLACAAITALAVAVPIGFPATRRPTRSPCDGVEALPHQRVRSGRRWLAIGPALIVLNFAGAAYRPRPDRGDVNIKKRLITLLDVAIDTEGDIYCLLLDGTLRGPILRRDNSRGDIPEPYSHVQRPGKSISRPLRTIVFKEDGRILGYEGFPLNPDSIPRGLTAQLRAPWQRWFPVPFEWTPGPMTSRPYVIRDRLRSPLEMWSPILASAAMTILVFVLLWRQARRRRIDSASAAANPSPMPP